MDVCLALVMPCRAFRHLLTHSLVVMEPESTCIFKNTELDASVLNPSSWLDEKYMNHQIHLLHGYSSVSPFYLCNVATIFSANHFLEEDWDQNTP